jgi:ribose 1,5-bisphosphokinase PhnN
LRSTEATLLSEVLTRVLAEAVFERCPEGPPLPELPSCVVVVGASCTGKTTLVDAVRHAQLPGVFVATRYVTRPRRANDSCKENIHLDSDAFAARQAAGEIAWAWSRPMHGSRVIRYGFDRAPQGSLPLYSANNALYRHSDTIQPAGVIDNALWVGLHAPAELRRLRMAKRSSDLSESEREFRLADVGDDMRGRVHLVLNNHGEKSDSLKPQMCALMAALATSQSLSQS